jgi:hypothetical protein
VPNELLNNPDQAALQRQAERDFIWPKIEVGEPGVLWFPHANRANTPSPCVVNEESNGIITATIFPKNGTPYTKTGVRHVDDPFHKGHSNSGKQNGGWDYYTPALRDSKIAMRRNELAKAAKLKEAEEKALKEARKKAQEEDDPK